MCQVRLTQEMDSQEKVSVEAELFKDVCKAQLAHGAFSTSRLPPLLHCRSGRELFTPWGWRRSVSWARLTRYLRIMYDQAGWFCRNETTRLFWRQPGQPSAPPRPWSGSSGSHDAARGPHPLLLASSPSAAGRARWPGQLLQARGQRLSASSEGLGADKTALQLSGGKATCHSTMSLFGTWTVPMELVEWVKPTLTLCSSPRFTDVHRAVL